MADLIDFGARLKASQKEQTQHLRRVDLTAKMIPVMVAAVEKMRTLGADDDHIERFLRAAIDELQKE
jgi:hypothetical protein